MHTSTLYHLEVEELAVLCHLGPVKDHCLRPPQPTNKPSHFSVCMDIFLALFVTSNQETSGEFPSVLGATGNHLF